MNLRRRHPCIFYLTIQFVLFVFFLWFMATPFCVYWNFFTTIEEHEPRSPALGQPSFNAYLAVLILSSPTSEGAARRRVIRDTWLKLHDHGVFYRFVIGKGAEMDLVKNEPKDVLILDNLVDSYNDLSLKVLMSMAWLNEHVDFQYALKVDDDSFVRLDALCQELLSIKHPKKANLYWGYIDGRAPVFRQGKWAEKDWILCDRYLPHALGGGYILAKKLVDFIGRNKDLFQLYKSEDVSVGAWLAGLDVYYKHDIRFDTEWESRGCRNGFLITHKQSKEKMKVKYDRIMKNGKLCEKEHDDMPAFEYDWNALPSKCCKRDESLKV